MTITNSTYDFNKITARKIIDEAYLICGIQPEKIDNKLIETAIFNINLVITSWINAGVLQFNETQTLIKLQNNLIRYELPKQFYDVYDFNLASMGRRRSGTYYATGGGNAANAFDNNLSTACTQSTPNGVIGINFGNEALTQPIRIDFFGLLSHKPSYYKIIVEGSNDGVNFIPVYEMKRPYYFTGNRSELSIQWFQINQPQPFQYFQIREVGGNTLDISEIYFEQYQTSLYRKNVGRSVYMQMGSRANPSNPTLYSLEKQSDKVVMNLFQAPSGLPEAQDYAENSFYNNFALLRAVEYPFDVNYLHEEININRLFIPALQYGVASHLALKVNRPDLVSTLSQFAEVEYQKAKQTNNDLGGIQFSFRNYTA